MLAAVGVEFEAVVPEVEELRDDAAAEDLVVENARRKAWAGLEMTGGEGRVALGVDTEVVLDGKLLGKAVREEEARDRLTALSGRTHQVLSGVCLAGAEERTGVARSLVTFTDLSNATVERYIGSGEWRDRAGAYAIQGLGSILVGRLEGDFSNVVGLPLQLLLELAPELFSAISSRSSA